MTKPDSEYAINPRWRLLLADLGVSEDDLLRRAGLPRDLLSGPATALPAEQFFALWEAVDAETGDACLPLLVARALSIEAFDPAIFAATCSKNLDVAVRRIAAHKRLVGPMRLSVTATDAETSIELVWPPHRPPPPSLALAELLFWVALARLATRVEVKPVRVTSPDPPPPDDAALYRDYLGVAVVRGSAHSITFTAADATRPFLTASEALWEAFEPELRRRLSDLDADTSTAGKVRALLLELLPAGEASMEAVGRELCVSPRTLQRRLQEEATSFQAVLNATRESLARHYLSQSDLPVTEISFLLGYDDHHSFYRAFQSWTGLTPQMARAGA